jgi:hypothetical protein
MVVSGSTRCFDRRNVALTRFFFRDLFRVRELRNKEVPAYALVARFAAAADPSGSGAAYQSNAETPRGTLESSNSKSCVRDWREG